MKWLKVILCRVACPQGWKPKPENPVLKEILETQTETDTYLAKILKPKLEPKPFFLETSKPKLKLKPVQNFLRFQVLKIVITILTSTVPLTLSVE